MALQKTTFKGLRDLFQQAKDQSRFLSCFQRESFYTEPSHLSHQWHLWTDGTVVNSMIRIHGAWELGPELGAEDLLSEERMREEGHRLLQRVRKGKEIAVWGLIIHLADEFGLAPIRKAMDEPQGYESAMVRILDDPQALVEERISDAWAYHYLPLPGSRSAVAIKLSQRFEKVLAPHFEVQSPLRISLRSGVLELLAFLGFYLPVDEEMVGEGRILVLAFLRFTVLAIIRSTEGLASIATLSHGSGHIPADIGFRVAAGLKQAGISAGTIWILQASEGARSQELRSAVDHYLSADEGFAESIQIMELPYEFLENMVSDSLGEKTIGVRPEMLLEEVSVAPLAIFGDASQSKQLRNLAKTNFSKSAIRIASQRLSRREAFWLLGARCLVAGLLLVVILGGIGFSSFFWQAIKSEAWRLNMKDFMKSSETAANLESIHQAYRTASDLLTPRSQAWSALEAVARIFPEGSGIRLRSLDYEVQPLPSQRLGGEANRQSEPRSFVRIWKISGIANPMGEGFLDRLGRQWVSSEFGAVSELYGAGIFQTERREVIPVVERHPQPGVKLEDGTIYGTRFSVVLEQVISSDDPYAFPSQTLRLPAQQTVQSFIP